MSPDDKATALDSLYNHVAQVAVTMNGKPYRAVEHLSFPVAMVAAPRGEDVPTLRVAMPNGFEVEFCPTFPLSLGNALSVRAKRIYRGQPKNDYTFMFGSNGWARGAGSLSDDDLRSCLTPDGPLPA
jgi:hypothetical protein